MDGKEEPFDHDLDWPWTLFFNGEAMPVWANGWGLCELSEHAARLFQEQSRLPDHQADLRGLIERMDAAHLVDSEDPDLFRICCLAFLSLLLRHQAEVLETLVPVERWRTGAAPALTIFNGVRDGLIRMHQLTVRDGFAFWSVGYESDLVRLKEAIRRFQVPKSDPDWLEAPHLRRRYSEGSELVRSLRCGLLDLLRASHFPKELRGFIHGLPTRL